MSEDRPRGLDELGDLLARLSHTPLGARLASSQLRHRHRVEALRKHPDPRMREIGEKLRDGRLRPRDLLDDPAYRGMLEGALRQLRDMDQAALRGRVERYVAGTRPADRGPGTDAGAGSSGGGSGTGR